MLIRRGSGKREDFGQGRSRRAEKGLRSGKGGMRFPHQREENRCPAKAYKVIPKYVQKILNKNVQML